MNEHVKMKRMRGRKKEKEKDEIGGIFIILR
jgi:hypothetical protein